MGISISAVIPCYNDGEFIADAIQSCLSQSVRTEEIIIVDDGSTDNTADAVSEFSNNTNYIKTSNRGAAAARNTGVAQAQSEYIAFLDADDYWLEDKIQRIKNAIKKSQATDLVYSDFYIRENNEIRREVSALDSGDNFPEKLFVSGGSILPSCSVVRKSTFQKLGGFDESLEVGHDRDLWIRIGMEGCVKRVPEPLTIRTVRDTSLASDYMNKSKYEIQSRKKLVKNYPEFKKLVDEREANLYANRASYALTQGKTREARRYSKKSILQNPRQYKPIFVLVISILPSGLSKNMWNKLRELRRRGII